MAGSPSDVPPSLHPIRGAVRRPLADPRSESTSPASHLRSAGGVAPLPREDRADWREVRGGKEWEVRFFILASVSPGVFNFGGDLSLFIRCVAENDVGDASGVRQGMHRRALSVRRSASTSRSPPSPSCRATLSAAASRSALASDILVSEKQRPVRVPRGPVQPLPRDGGVQPALPANRRAAHGADAPEREAVSGRGTARRRRRRHPGRGRPRGERGVRVHRPERESAETPAKGFIGCGAGCSLFVTRNSSTWRKSGSTRPCGSVRGKSG